MKSRYRWRVPLLLLLFLLVLSQPGTGTSDDSAQNGAGVSLSPINPVFTQYLNDFRSRLDLSSSSGNALGLVPATVDLSHLTGTQISDFSTPTSTDTSNSAPVLSLRDSTSSTEITSYALPGSYDLRTQGRVNGVQDQGECGSCWAFGTLAPLECAIKIRDGISVDLAEQWLLSCNKDGWDCDGGFFAHDYLVSKNDLCRQTGAVMESDFPYAATELPCECPYERHYWIDSWAYIGNSYTVPATEDIKQAVMTYGPVSVGVFVNDAWYGYSGGIFNACEVGNTNHAVAIVGWDDNFQGSGVGVWIVKNSWGADWGDDGFIYMPYGCSLIGEGACYIEFDLPGFFFWADTTFGWAPVDVNFEAYSPLTVDSWHWDFGDGTTSILRNPAHVYETRGFKKVTLVVTNVSGSKKTSKSLTVVPRVSTASFAFAPTTPGPGEIVQFSDTTAGEPTSWLWNFGDGGTSNLQTPPPHQYTNPGTYTVELTVTDSCGGTDVATGSTPITVVAPPTVDFSGTPTTGCAPLTSSLAWPLVASTVPEKGAMRRASARRSWACCKAPLA